MGHKIYKKAHKIINRLFFYIMTWMKQWVLNYSVITVIYEFWLQVYSSFTGTWGLCHLEREPTLPGGTLMSPSLFMSVGLSHKGKKGGEEKEEKSWLAPG